MITSTTYSYWTDHTDYPTSTGDINAEDLATITTTSTQSLCWTSKNTNFTVSSPLPPIIVQDAYDKIEKRRYHCIYCGTEYIEEKEGFIPNCKNCGAILRKCQE